ncbi:Panacea domain-containing protein [Streptosporangium sp. CA-115845]|uniref:Panacea domain-containing protein n=1 Tax=Streptosporangium sp. CA-115845 TaxID=3240071 RepID=UPI003D917C6C
MKLQKLCYYFYGYHLAWEERQLFPERFEAWANGPVFQPCTPSTAADSSSRPATSTPWTKVSASPSTSSWPPTATSPPTSCPR